MKYICALFPAVLSFSVTVCEIILVHKKISNSKSLHIHSQILCIRQIQKLLVRKKKIWNSKDKQDENVCF